MRRSLPKSLFVLLGLFILAGCTGGASQLPRERIYFATDRAPASAKSGDFGARRNETANPMNYGRATVTLNGAMLQPFSATPLDRAAFLKQMAGARRVLVFVHGYRMSFPRAVSQAGQIAHDLHYGGPVILFSWPSRGTTLGYARDATNARWAETDIENLLAALAAARPHPRVDILAHSLGSQPVVEGLRDLQDRHAPLRLGNIVLAAPDMDADLFRRDAPALLAIADRVTLYASAHDEALKASRGFNGYPRAGDASEGIVALKGLDTIDASAASDWRLGHAYYRDPSSVLSDIALLLNTGAPPSARPHLASAEAKGMTCWRFVP